MSLSKELQTGKAGEHLVCCDLILQGYNAFLADQGLPFDILIENNSELQKKYKFVQQVKKRLMESQRMFIDLEPVEGREQLQELVKQK